MPSFLRARKESLLIRDAATMAWLTWDTKSIIVCIMERMSSLMEKSTSMALNHSGPMQKGDS
jgi:hypothetical protein